MPNGTLREQQALLRESAKKMIQSCGMGILPVPILPVPILLAGKMPALPFAEVAARILRNLGGDYVTIAPTPIQTSLTTMSGCGLCVVVARSGLLSSPLYSSPLALSSFFFTLLERSDLKFFSKDYKHTGCKVLWQNNC